jgi:ATP-dependent RNA helicase DDX24/MAK5
MGEGAKGSSLSLVAPAEDKAHSKIAEAANVAFTKVMLDGRLLTAAQERTNLASKIIEATEMENKANSTNKWFTEKAKEADLDLDDDVIERESQWSEKEQHQLREAQKAKVRLAQLLAEPMKTQRYGKFLSTNSAAIQAEIEPLPKKR